MKRIIKKICKIIFVFIIFIVILTLLLISIIKIYITKFASSNLYYSRGISIIPTADYIIVPGAKIKNDKPNIHLKHRLDYAYDLYKANKSDKIILSGGYDSEESSYEPLVMLSYLVDLGVPKENIIIDLHGDNTFSTLKRVKDFVNNGHVIFCTQEVYSYRALYIANKLDLNMDVFCSDPVIYSGRGKSYVRELFANVKAILNFSILQPNVSDLVAFPFYNGEEVSI